MSAPLSPPTDLTLPEPGSTTARRVLSRAIGVLFGDLRDLMRRPAPAGALARDLATVRGAIASLTNREAALSTVLRSVNVGALLRCTRGPLDAPIAEPLLAELLATLAVELAVIGALGKPLTLDAPPRHVVSLAGRFALRIPHGASLSIEGRRLSLAPSGVAVDLDAPRAVEHGDAAVVQPFSTVSGDVLLAVEDNNPLSMYEAHPRKSGNRIDLGDHSVSEWCASLAASLESIAQYEPELRAEIDLFVQQFVPVGFDAEAHLSASYREAIGTIYLTLHPSEMTMTEAVIHEFSHNKLNALFEIDEVLHNAYAPLFRSPVRPDPRPLHGILLAVHAFIPIARYYERLESADAPQCRRSGFRERFANIVKGNHEGMSVLLEHADPTPAGRALLGELERWDQHFVGKLG